MPYKDPAARQAYQREYQAINAERLRAKRHLYRAANAEKVAAQKLSDRRKHWREAVTRTKVWRAVHPLEAKLQSFNLRARRRGLTGSLAIEQLQDLLDRAGGVCLACDKPFGTGRLKWTLDHKIPSVMGGTHTVENCQILCFGCNCLVKNDTAITYLPLNYFRASKG